MPILKKGSQGASVTELQNILRELDYNIPVTGVFDAATVNAVKDFQARHLDKHNNPLVVDGSVGDLTMWALKNPRSKVSGGAIDFSEMPDEALGGHPIGRLALQVAINELKAGAGEIGGNNKGPFVKKYLDPTGLPEGNSWCAAFISWCFLKAVDGDKKAMPFKYNAGARNVFNQFKQKGWHYDATDVSKLPQPGDIVAWWRVSLPSGFGHIAIVHHFKDGFLYTLEGNKAANVAGFDYVKTRMDKVLGYGRIQ
jgi:hypothetical protein